jgi:hypothetical protein
MSATERRLQPILAALVALAILPAASAAPILSGQAVGESYEAARALQEARTEFVHLHDEAGDATRLHLAAKGARMTAYQYTDTSPEASGAGYEMDVLGLRGTLGQNDPQVRATADAEFTVDDIQPYYVMLVIGHGALDRTGSLAQASGTTMDRPVLTEEGITTFAPQSSPPVPLDLPRGEPDAIFSHPVADGRRIVTTAGAASTLELSGTFTLELYGLSGRLSGTDGAWDVESGRWAQPLAPGVPDGSVRQVRESFLRIVVQDGTLTASIAAAELLQFSDFVATTESESLVLHGATGTFTLADGAVQQVSGSTFAPEGLTRAQSEPSDAGMRVALTGLGADGQPRSAPSATAIRIPDSVTLGLTGLFLVVAATATVAGYALRRRPASMEEVETALVGGRYMVAARMAGRVLRRRPDSEEAMISRAVALTKAGRPQRVVRELTAHMARREPSDGVLHYVLGLAYLDLGELAPGEKALREAMRRTPALAAQVRSRLPSNSAQQGSRPEHPSWDGSADSRGYA